MLNTLSFGAPGATTPVLIVHGLFGSGRNWGVIARRMADRGLVFAPDMRNHGDSFRSPVHDYPALAGDLAKVIETHGGPMDVLGHSMGGKAAMVLALTRPDLVRRLIVADIAPVAYTHSQRHFIEAMRGVDLQRVAKRSDAAAQLAETVDDPALQSFFTQSLDVQGRRWKLNLDALDDQMAHVLGFPDMAGRFDGPALFLSGGLSDYVRSEHRPKIRSLFAHARHAKLPQAGHWLHADAPRDFEASVRAYLDMSL